MKKKVKDIAAIRRLIRKTARKASSFVHAASAKAALAAALVGVLTFEYAIPDDYPGYGTKVWGTAYALDLGGRKALLVHYKLVDEWGSPSYNHTEEGVALYDPSTGEAKVLAFWGQHAGESEFGTMFPDELFKFGGPLGPTRVMRDVPPVAGEWAPRVKYPRPIRRAAGQRRRPHVSRPRLTWL